MKKLAFSLALGVAASVVGAQGIYQANTATSSGLSAPATLTLTGYYGREAVGVVTVTNLGPGFASNLSLSLSPSGTAKDGAYVQLASDTCTGATLAVHGTCHVQVQAYTTCPLAKADNWTLGVLAASGQASQTTVQVISKGGQCD